MPPEPMSTPMVMKKGTAIRLKDEMPLTIRRQTSVRAWPLHHQAEHTGKTNGVCNGEPQKDHHKEADQKDKDRQCLNCHINSPPL